MCFRVLEQYTRKRVRRVCLRVQARSRGGGWAGLSRRKLVSFAGPGEIKRREVVLDPQESPDEIKRREVELGSESWTSFASVVTQQRSNGHCPCDCSAHQLKQQLYTSCCALAEPLTLFLPLPPPLPPSVPVPNKPPLFCGRKATCLYLLTCMT